MNVIVKLQGGLGNQMFQYAFGKYISKKTDRKLILDTSFLDNKNRGENFVYRDYDLDIFDIDVDLVKEFTEPCQVFKENYDLVHEVDYLLIERILNSFEKNIYLDGYWASPEYFNHIEFKFKNNVLKHSEELLKRIRNNNSVMINIRRCDFTKNDFHATYGKEYVLKGIKNLNMMNLNNLKYFIFSDDIKWCEENLIDIPNSEIIYHEHKGEKFSNYLVLMSECKYFIIPNSTFAWWSAYISKSKNKKVLYPEIWLKGMNKENKSLFYNLNWNKNL